MLVVVSFLSFILWLFFICWCSSFTLPFRGLSPSFYTHFILSAQPIAEWFTTLWFSAILLSSYCGCYGFEWAFLPTGVFYLTLLPDIFGTTCYYQGIRGRRPFFLEVCRASYWFSKNRPGPSVCLIHSNPQSFLHLKFVFIHVNIAKVLLVVKTLIKYYSFQVQFLLE